MNKILAQAGCERERVSTAAGKHLCFTPIAVACLQCDSVFYFGVTKNTEIVASVVSARQTEALSFQTFQNIEPSHYHMVGWKANEVEVGIAATDEKEWSDHRPRIGFNVA